MREGIHTTFPPLPAPPGANTDDDTWRAAFAVPLGLVSSRSAKFLLETSNSGAFPLPAPPRLAQPEPERAPAKAPDRATGAQLERQLREQLRNERLTHGRLLRRVDDERARAEEAHAGLREELTRTLGQTTKLLGRIDALEADAAELEATANAERRLHSESRRARDEAERALTEKRSALKDTRAELELVRAKAEDRAAALKAVERQLARVRERAEQQQAQASARAATLERRLEEHTRALEKAKAETTLAASDAAALEREVERLNEGIKAHLARQSSMPVAADRLALAREQLERGALAARELERRVEDLVAAIPRPAGRRLRAIRRCFRFDSGEVPWQRAASRATRLTGPRTVRPEPYACAGARSRQPRVRLVVREILGRAADLAAGALLRRHLAARVLDPDERHHAADEHQPRAEAQAEPEAGGGGIRQHAAHARARLALRAGRRAPR